MSTKLKDIRRYNSALGAYVSAWQMEVANFERDHDFVAQAQRHQDDLTSALTNYHKWQKREMPAAKPLPVLWQGKLAQLCDCGGIGHPLLMVPSLINGPEIFDITEDDSLINALKRAGFHIYLLKWGSPHPGDPHKVHDYTEEISQAAEQIPSAKFGAIGYCLGGTLLHLAAPHMKNLQALTLLGAPWNFHHHETKMGRWASNLTEGQVVEPLQAIKNTFGLMPSIYIDHFFAALNPLQFVHKFKALGEGNPKFDAIEDWLTNGRDLDMGFAQILFDEWMRQNRLVTMSAAHDVPTLLVQGQNDHIAPPASCQPLILQLTNAWQIVHRAGHMGMLVGRTSQDEIWPQIARFQNSHIK